MTQRVLLRDRLPPLWAIAGVAIVVAGCATWMFWSARDRGLLSPPKAVCREAYGHAHTARDSAVVDLQIPTDGMGRGHIGGALSCGVLRLGGELR
jgi:hypothetical protein